MTLYRPSKPHFFQPLLPGFQSTFLIPKSFLQHLRDHAEDCDGEIIIAKLIDRKQKIWYVKIGSDRRHLEDGWAKFCNDHNLQIGDFLVFRHLGNFVFDVLIFDPTACEREIPSFDDQDLSQAREIKASCSNDQRNCDTINALNVDGSENMGDESSDEELPETEIALVISTARPYFRTVVTSSHLKSGVIVVPTQFARQNGLTTTWCDIVLKTKSSWKSRTKLLWYNSTKKDNGGYYILGWPSFYKVHGFKRDDIICFELIDNGDKPIMKYYRVGNMKDGNQEHADEEFASLQSNDCPYFRSIVRGSSLKRGETGIPKHFALQNGLMKRCYVELIDEKGQSRTMRLGYISRGSVGTVCYIRGCPPFYHAYGLKKGDVIIFELICNGVKPIMKFYNLQR